MSCPPAGRSDAECADRATGQAAELEAGHLRGRGRVRGHCVLCHDASSFAIALRHARAPIARV